MTSTPSDHGRDARATIGVLYCFTYNHGQDARATFQELSKRLSV